MRITATLLLISCSILGAMAQQRFDVPGSRISIVIPKGTVTSPHYSAITKPDVFEISILESQVNSESEYRVIDSISYANKGVKVYEEFDMSVDGYKGKVIHVYSNPLADAVQFIFGDSTFFILASTLYTRGDKELYNEILGYYESIVVDEAKSIDWKEFISINYDESSPLKFETEMINPHGLKFKKETDSSNTYILIQQFPNVGIFADAQSFLSQTITAYFNSYEVDQFLFEGYSELNGKSVYEFSSYAISSKGGRHLIHCIARLTDGLGTMICAIVMNPEDEVEVKKFLRTMEFKN